MSAHHHHHGALRGVKALAFDVFGTVVDWRTSVEAELRAPAPAGTAVDWARFAADRRASYTAFTSGLRAGETSTRTTATAWPSCCARGGWTRARPRSTS